MKKILLLAIGLLVFATGYSQAEGKFRVGLDFGYATPLKDGAGGPSFSIEPKYNIKDNMSVGLRIGGVAIARDVKSSGQTIDCKLSANGNYVGTLDYYFNGSGKSFVPYVGAGIGYYSIANIELKDTTSINKKEVKGEGKIGGLLRIGFEWTKFRMGVEYNIVPKSDMKDTAGVNLGTVSNSYFGIHAGFFIGGGKWGKK